MKTGSLSSRPGHRGLDCNWSRGGMHC